MSKYDTGLNYSQRERLALLAEECGEVVGIIGKILRHGYVAIDNNTSKSYDNRALLEQEVGDVAAVMRLMIRAKDINKDKCEIATQSKRERLKKYLHYQPERIL